LHAVKLTAFYQLTLCTAVVAASPVAAAHPTASKVRGAGSGQHRHAVASRYGAGAEQSRKGNEVRSGTMLRGGQRLSIPRVEPSDEGARGRGSVAEGKSKSSSAKAALIPSAVAPIRHKVAAGETLGEIAQRAGTTIEELARTNALGKGKPLQVGQVLVLPSLAKSPRKSWHVYARPPKQRGFLDLSTHSSRFSGQALGADGRLRTETVRALNNLLGAGGNHPAIPERLVRLLVEVSDTFGGRPLRLVSGYRTTSYFEDSRHKLSSAIDFMVVGVPNAVVCEYLREIEDVGVGYYPNSSFVHMDVRDHSAYWVDYAGPGEPPRSSPNAPPRHAPSRPVRPADRKLVAALDRVLAETKRGLQQARATAHGEAAATTKPERERQAGTTPPAPPSQPEPASHAAFDELALSVTQHEAASGSKPSEP
jgi:uncharacterized protein YcbK (DUF882 family)